MQTEVNNIQRSSAQSTRNDEDVCPVCGKNRRRDTVICGVKYSFHVMCKCEEKQEKAAKENLKNLDKMRKIEKLKSLSLLGERYKAVTFSNSITGINSSFDTAFNRCKKYCELYEGTVKNGCGIYLFGDKGIGKTHCATRF